MKWDLIPDSGMDQNLEREKRTKKLETSITLSSSLILEYGQQQKIIPKKIYLIEEELYSTVKLALQVLEDKIRSVNMYDSFWDLNNKGKIATRSPKSEVDIVASYMD